MSDGVTVTLVASAVWLGVLSLVSATLVREVAILRVRLDRGLPSFNPETDGPDIGTAIPPEVRLALPELEYGRVYLLIVSAICATCRDLVPQLRANEIRAQVVALVPGNDPDLVASLLELFPSDIRTIRDPQAVTLARVLQVRSTPFALEIEGDRVTGKAYLHDASYLLNLIAARREQGKSGIAQRKEVVGNV